mmetsp:Transcript_25613/g.38310  ORF Transcript_25613/g.38310 Transcript_25613/m.38310 type:complete len:136 (+) Transcript_25613:470-877(+)
MMPFKSFARKNNGYLFAISNDAQVIYDFDDDNTLPVSCQALFSCPLSLSLVFKSSLPNCLFVCREHTKKIIWHRRYKQFQVVQERRCKSSSSFIHKKTSLLSLPYVERRASRNWSKTNIFMFCFSPIITGTDAVV